MATRSAPGASTVALVVAVALAIRLLVGRLGKQAYDGLAGVISFSSKMIAGELTKLRLSLAMVSGGCNPQLGVVAACHAAMAGCHRRCLSRRLRSRTRYPPAPLLSL
jgi:hypothetical protein